ncbi:uncharacterized protein BDW47DRAFT_130728 [Aspergillus candidus]|uniref:Uncharacterized protein n=1 Tax=Aspergillus candidus TaxID=41067 RepID=A0A2I2EXN1_ASPCN|nr:hypothetical protein BDW47DRAFT_130728 [Aspergillus candidus]PLB33137.1 hypothetical protein BDW47DRAFT_130728 [Aspergillus candidus]
MSFNIVNGQIYTPGLAIVDAPQPNTPLGGDTLHIAIDISGNGKLSLDNDEDEDKDKDTHLHSLTLFLTSTDLSKNFTISNGTSPHDHHDHAPYVGPVLDLEPSSTVKHVDWTWPACLVGEGSGGAARGKYNISMHQSFRWRGVEHYTVFDLPISVSNSIEESDERVDCASVENELLDAGALAASNDTLDEVPWVGEVGASGEEADADAAVGSARAGVWGWALVAMVGYWCLGY